MEKAKNVTPMKRKNPFSLSVIDYVSSSNTMIGESSSSGLSAKRKSLLAQNLRAVSNTTSNGYRDEYEDIGDCTYVCEFCNATFWYNECVKSSCSSQRPQFNQCCRSGRVKFALPKDPPESVKNLFSNPNFMRFIRTYNSMFAMTSFGASIDESINVGTAPYVFKISGQICHRIGSFCPPVNSPPRFLQMYIYDTENELVNRLRIFNDDVTSCLDPNFVQLLIGVLDDCNELVKLFRTARDFCRDVDISTFSISLHSTPTRRNYELPTMGTIGAIIHGTQSKASDFDIIIHGREDGPRRVNKLHPMYMALQYPLLFIYGERGWSLDLFTTGNDGKERLTPNMFYSYQLHDRPDLYNVLLKGGRLFQQYIVDAYVCIEQGRLDYFQANQDKLRTEYLQGVHDALSRGDTDGHQIGKRVILPSSFTGGPRYMYKHYQDALAICRVYGNPQYFITFTCNVKWPEFQRMSLQSPPINIQDRPDLISRVFRIKVKSFVKYLKSGVPFGEVTAVLYTIEFQKRGLPHCHTLLWVKAPFRIQTAAEVDKYISAEIPDPNADATLHRIVTQLMLHDPCGESKPKSSCMIGDKCSKGFPKRLQQETKFDEKGYVHYKRSLNGFTTLKGGVTMDNSNVVPYNRALLLRYHAHINVECCGWNMVIKYLFKYISKGPDHIRFNIKKSPSTSAVSNTASSSNNSSYINEITNFQNGRFICPHEAAWRIFDFPIHYRKPAVFVLAVHLECMQTIRFCGKQKIRRVVENEFIQRTTLTEWLRNNAVDGNGRHLRYVDYSSMYRWDISCKRWLPRVYNKKTPAIGRLAYVHPSSGDSFYLRMLLNHQKGCTSFAEIRTVNGEVCETYREACAKLGLLQNDDEWTYAIDEAAAWATSQELRSLFVHMLLFCEISNPLQLWNKHWRSMSDDFHISNQRFLNFQLSHVTDDLLQQHVLLDLEFQLNTSVHPLSLSQFGLPMPSPDSLSILRNRLLMEEKDYDLQQLAAEHEVLKTSLHTEQAAIYQQVINSANNKDQTLIFVYGHGGTGKTFLWKTLTYALRSSGKIVLTVAASGIASLLLPSGRTAHSRFKIPLDLTEESLCHIKKKTHIAELLIQTSLIIWDEAPMSDRRSFECLDRTLRDLLDNPHEPFGGKSILLGGDFRQTLPVVQKASKAYVISLSLPRSYLWPYFKVFKLTQNMRLLKSSLGNKEKDEIDKFSKWLLDIGDGNIGFPCDYTDSDKKVIDIPRNFLIPFDGNIQSSLFNLINFIYDQQTLSAPTIYNFLDKAIICPKNTTAYEINKLILNNIPTESTNYLSLDSLTPRENHTTDPDLLYPPEYLNSLDFPGYPPHSLELKLGCPIILLRNINQSAGLCNGTLLNFWIGNEIRTGSYVLNRTIKMKRDRYAQEMLRAFCDDS